MSGPAPSDSDRPACLLCGRPTRLLYRSNVPRGKPIRPGEVACTSPFLSFHDDIYFCRRCRLARSAPPMERGDLEEVYRQVEDPDYLISEEERRASFREALGQIERFRAPGSLLEVGAGVGLFLEEARQRGWTVVGVEPSLWASEQSRRRKLEVHAATLDEFDPGGRQFDAVALWDVLEHLVDPVGALKRVGKLLKPEGILALTTVNIGGVGAKLFRGRWPWLMRMHLHYFTSESLAELARRESFEVLSLSTQPKVLKLGYVLDRARGLFGPLAAIGRWAADRLHLASRPVTVNLGDILLLVARRK